MKLRIRIPFNVAGRYRVSMVLAIAFFWTLIDSAVYVYRFYYDNVRSDSTPFDVNTTTVLILRVFLIFGICLIMAWLLVYLLKRMARHLPLWISLCLKILILLAAAFVLNFLLHFTYIWLIEKQPTPEDINELNYYYYEIFQTSLVITQLARWLAVFLFTILFIEVNEKYSPGVFFDILSGKYLTPKVENRIVVFIDLANSTTIAEQLGNTKYFRFIRDFIYFISTALLENNGQIYQYVGDEVVVSWKVKDARANRRCVKALLDCKKILLQNKTYFKRRYGVIPEFRAGIHAGEVTVGEIGVIKKDLAMSGDIMNTAARLRSFGSELGQHFVASREFVVACNLNGELAVPLGKFDLKGKESATEIYSLQF
jgi:adenylate cyclase